VKQTNFFIFSNYKFIFQVSTNNVNGTQLTNTPAKSGRTPAKLSASLKRTAGPLAQTPQPLHATSFYKARGENEQMAATGTGNLNQTQSLAATDTCDTHWLFRIRYLSTKLSALRRTVEVNQLLKSKTLSKRKCITLYTHTVINGGKLSFYLFIYFKSLLCSKSEGNWVV
jgi:hypothetical protein